MLSGDEYVYADEYVYYNEYVYDDEYVYADEKHAAKKLMTRHQLKACATNQILLLCHQPITNHIMDCCMLISFDFSPLCVFICLIHDSVPNPFERSHPECTDLHHGQDIMRIDLTLKNGAD